MSKVSQELRTLLYLNQHSAGNCFISVATLAEYLEVSTRQARRYLDELALINEIKLEIKRGKNGGYRLSAPLDPGLAMPENMVLALSIAMKRNERIEKVLTELPNYVISETVAGDNAIDNKTMDNLEVLITAISNRRSVTFHYKDDDDYLFFVDPYKIIFTNKTYYLNASCKDQLKRYDCSLMKDIKPLGGYKPDKSIEKEISESLGRYGVRSGEQATLRVKCVDLDALRLFDKYFEGKGIMNREKLTYEVVGRDEHELYYPLFRISTKKYEFLDEEFKKGYIKYLRNQIRSIERNGKS